MENNFENLSKIDNTMLNINIRGYENSDITDEKKRELYKKYLGQEFPELAEKIYASTKANFIG